ncbi:MAG: 16S rRNA (cytidine(1402)-2'-O)-methyltransferase [Pseudomonadota bacterium]
MTPASSGILHVVATPIGNLGDITLNAVKILGKVHVIACEDTRKTGILLRHLGIRTPTVSLHKFNEVSKIETVLGLLRQGKDVALVTDAGTPGISDPGTRLVRAVLDAGFRVTPVPGPSSITAALSIAGVECSEFTYLGFVPRTDAKRHEFFRKVSGLGHAAVFFETPVRVKDSLRVASEVLGTQKIVLLRELTKIYEEILRGTAGEVSAILEVRPSIKGEVVIVTEPEPATPLSEDNIAAAVKELMEEGFSGKRLAHEARERHGIGRGDAYDVFLKIRAQEEEEMG